MSISKKGWEISNQGANNQTDMAQKESREKDKAGAKCIYNGLSLSYFGKEFGFKPIIFCMLGRDSLRLFIFEKKGRGCIG